MRFHQRLFVVNRVCRWRNKTEWFDVVPTELQGSLRPLPGLGFSMQGALCVFTNASLLSTVYAVGGIRRNGSMLSQLSFKAVGLCRALVFPCKQLCVFSPFNFITALSSIQATGGVAPVFQSFCVLLVFLTGPHEIWQAWHRSWATRHAQNQAKSHT